MILKEIFEKDVQRPIEGVIKADDAEHLRTEVEEYVLTNEAAKELEKLLEEYTNYTTANGVWISGFFGSGKSHMLKMLAHLLGDVDGQDFPRDQVSLAFRAKAAGAFLQGSLSKAERIPASSLLFNIAQKATVIAKDQSDALLKVFVKVFDEFRGYFGNQGHVARMERDLDRAGQYAAFQDAFVRLTGKQWLDERRNYIIQGRNIDRAYAEIVGGDAPTDILRQYSNDYSVSIEDFAQEVADWLEQQPAGFRLNFFVDEVGQFIGDDARMMLDLQTIAESLNTKANGRSWVFVTSQEDMDKIIGDMTQRQAQDFSRIQARFKTRVKLTSQDVEEVIRKRLLEKNEYGAIALRGIYSAESANFKTLFGFADGSKTYKNYGSEDLFVGTYPFVSYQFPLFQQAIEGLSAHNAFEGRNSSVGERSMLGVVQEVAKELGAGDVGSLASFDHMFAGIRSSLKGAPQRQVQLAEQNLDNPLAVRLLKALFLVKYVDGFKATVRNLTVLVYNRFGLDLPALQEQVREGLALLEQQTYVQRTGETYAYLTNEEQDIEKEIKNVEVDGSEVSDRLFQLLHLHVMKQQPKFRYSKTNQDFPLGYMLDDVAKGQSKDLTIHFITPANPNISLANPNDFTNVRLQGAGKAELRVILGADKRLLTDLALLLKTAKYVKQKQGSAITDSVKRILDQKTQESASREKELAARIKTAVGQAMLIHDTVEIPSSSSVAEARITDGMNVLVTKTYPQLDLLGGKTFPEADVVKYVQPDDSALSMVGGELEGPADEVYKMGVLAKDKLGEQVTVKKIVDQFQARPYGWDYGSILCTIAYLYGAGKITIELDNVLRKRTEVPQDLRTAPRHATLIVRKQAIFEAAKVKAFSDFVKEFFDEANPPKDPMELAHFGAERLKSKLDQLKSIVATSRYPFIAALHPAIEQLDAVVGKAPTWYVSEFIGGDELVDVKNDVLVRIDQFLNGPQVKTYDAAQRFLAGTAANLNYLPSGVADSVESLLADPAIFRGNKANQLKMAVEQLEARVDELVSNERAAAVSAIEAKRGHVQQTDYYRLASATAQERAMAQIDGRLIQLEQQDNIAELRLAPGNFASAVVPRLLQELASARRSTETGPVDFVRLGGDVSVEIEDNPPAKTTKPTLEFISITKLPVHGGKTVLASTSDVNEYVELVRAVLTAAVQEGKRVTR
ncbi:BREX system P-loop protein BrxC [Microbacterium foliorum]|uniref:BREX system P-loop protein BrxC n=1 Tax=Microbacterium foliorum TaxID=104336 RepID=UPI003735EF43